MRLFKRKCKCETCQRGWGYLNQAKQDHLRLRWAPEFKYCPWCGGRVPIEASPQKENEEVMLRALMEIMFPTRRKQVICKIRKLI